METGQLSQYTDQALGWTFLGFDSQQGQEIILFSKTSILAMKPIQPSIPRVEGLFPRVSCSQDLANVSTLSLAEVQNTYMRLYFYSLIRLHKVYRNNFTLLLSQ